MQLRPYQIEAVEWAFDAWKRVKNIMLVEPTGAGKTVIMSEIIKRMGVQTCAIAHRQELVSQISMALARSGVRHKIIGADAVVRLCVKLHMEEFNRSYVDPNAKTAVASVNTLVKRFHGADQWAKNVKLWVQDECHHVLRENQWGDAANLFPNAIGLGVTATPRRADGKGLGRHHDGLFDEMFVGPSMRDLIDQKFLTEYRIFAPPNDIDLTNVGISKTTGDFSGGQLTKAVRKSHIVGDIVQHYVKICPGKSGVVFVPDLITAAETAEQFTQWGIPAEIVSGKTPSAERAGIIRKFRNGELKVLVNVDIFGEGFDLPAISFVSMARPTASYGLYVQQFGRALRLLEGKTEAVIIDHVGNVVRHGLPDAAQSWTLDRRDKRGRSAPSDAIPLTSCLNPECLQVYERVQPCCPHCGFKPVPGGRSRPEQVDGDLMELDASTLAEMRGDVAKVDRTVDEYRMELDGKSVRPEWQGPHLKRHAANQLAQEELRESIALWAGHQRALNRPDSESYRRFYHKFGIDVLSAQALKTDDAYRLRDKVVKELAH